MKGPYRFIVKDGDLELAAASNIGLLKDAEFKGHIAAGEWVEAGIVDYVTFSVLDSHDKEVRFFGVWHDEARGPKPLANTIVRQRLS